MYSPRISEDLIPVLYKEAQKQGKHMTTLVDELLRKALSSMEANHAQSRNHQSTERQGSC